MSTWKNKAAAAAAARAYRARNREMVRAKDRARDRTPKRQQHHAEQWEVLQARFFMAMMPSDEEILGEHDAWLESLDYLDDDLVDCRSW